MKEEYRYTIPGNPVTKKNSQRIIRLKNGRTLIKPSAAYEAYEDRALYFLQPLPEAPIREPVNVQCIYYMNTRRKVDLSNLLSATDDVLVTAAVLSDDNRDILAGHDGSRVFYDHDNPRTEILITPMSSYSPWKEE